MATVTVFNAVRMLAIEAASIIGGLVNGSGDLILTKHDGSTVNAGSVVGPQGPQGIQGPIGLANPVASTAIGTGASDNNKWVRLARVSLTSQYSDATCTFHVKSYNTSGYGTNTAIIDFRVKQQLAMGSAPHIKVLVSKFDTLGPHQVAAVTIQNDSSATIVDLYFWDTYVYDTMVLRKIAEESAGTAAMTYYTNAAYTASLPSGTVTYGTRTVSDTPAGAVMPFAGSSVPGDWLLCDGSAISRTGGYADLFAAIGTTYGAGDGSTTFNLPNLKGKIPVGLGTTIVDPEFDSLGKTGGEKTHVIATAELPVHAHSTTHTHTTPATNTGNQSATHAHASSSGGYILEHGTGIVLGNGGTAVEQVKTGNLKTAAADTNHLHSLPSMTTSAPSSTTSGDAGSGTAMNNIQPYLVMNYIIKI